jgi:hypothetical protein
MAFRLRRFKGGSRAAPDQPRFWVGPWYVLGPGEWPLSAQSRRPDVSRRRAAFHPVKSFAVRRDHRSRSTRVNGSSRPTSDLRADDLGRQSCGIAETNQNPKPFTGTADPDAMIHKARRGKEALESIH